MKCPSRYGVSRHTSIKTRDRYGDYPCLSLAMRQVWQMVWQRVCSFYLSLPYLPYLPHLFCIYSKERSNRDSYGVLGNGAAGGAGMAGAVL